ncbi:MAG: Rrf2 family transcriptional regulator [Spirochaetaceae bacterium]|jgi:Rrf2 family protein|nr:Rrf2 family transcriptional regulator [Spirochaetaceae bacterium]
MRISTKGRYSLEALLYMALLPEDRYTSAQVIAEGTDISGGYLEQLFIPLRRAGIVQGIRGPQGGYRPGRDLEAITVGDILRAVEGVLEPVPCVASETCSMAETCLSRHTWAELYREINDCADSITLADLAASYQALDQAEYTI